MKNTIKKILISSTAFATTTVALPTIVSCGHSYQQMDVKEKQVQKDKEIDSDVESVTYTFQQDTKNYADTKANIIDLNVHNQSVQVETNLITSKNDSDGTITITFDTQKFILDYLSKYYTNTNGSIPSKYKIELINEKNNTRFVSQEFTLTVTPAEYTVLFKSKSEALKFEQESTKIKVYQQLETTYTLDSKYKLSSCSITRYDGEQLLGKEGVIFDAGKIVIPAKYVTGGIYIEADATYAVCDIDAKTYVSDNVKISNLPDYVEKLTAIDAKYTIEGEGQEIKKAEVYIGSNKLTDGYSISNGNIHIDANKVTNDVTMVIQTGIIDCSIKTYGEHVQYTVSSSVQYKHEITGTYTIETEYTLKSDPIVYVGENKLTDGYTISNGNIQIDANKVVGDVSIYIPTIQSKFNLTTSGDKVTFSVPEKASYKEEITGTYEIETGYVFDSATVTVDGNVLTDGYTIANGQITIEADKVVGNVHINIKTKIGTFGVHGYGTGVNYSNLPDTIAYKTEINANYSITEPEVMTEAKVWIDDVQLTNGYSISNGKIHIDADKVTGEVYIAIFTTSTTHSVVCEGKNVKFINPPQSATYGTDIEIEFEISEGYHQTMLVVYVGETQVQKQCTISDNKIVIPGELITGNITVALTASIDTYKINVQSSNVTVSGISNIAKYKTAIDGSYTVSSGYELSTTAVTVGGVLLEDGYTIKDGHIHIEAEKVVGDISIVLYASIKTYQASVAGEHITINAPTSVEHGHNYVAEFYVHDGYKLKSAQVEIGGEPITSGFELTNERITIPGSLVKGNIVVKLITESEKYSVVGVGEHVTYTELPTSIEYKTKVTGKYAIENGYQIDESNSYVTVGGEKLSSGYSLKDGQISIDADKVTGDVVVNIATTKIIHKYTVTATGDNVVTFPTTIPEAIGGEDYKISFQLSHGTLKTISIKVGGVVLTQGTDFNIKDNIITIIGSKVNANIEITATGEPQNYGDVTYDLDDRLEKISYTKQAIYGQDISVTLKSQTGYSTITNYGCAVGGDETYTQYLEWNEQTKTLKLPGKYVVGSVKIWASVA